MSSKQKPDGCAVIMRRTFLVILGLVAAKYLHQYFQLAINRENFFRLVKHFTNKAISLFQDQTQPLRETPATLPSNPVIPTTKTSPPASSQPNLTNPSLPSNPVTPPTKPTISTSSKPTPAKETTPVKFEKKTLKGIAFYQTTVYLKDPETFLTIGLANDANQANSATKSSGDEDFKKLVKRHQGAVMINGTFFSKDAQKRVLGNMVAEGRFLKYSPWENYGTTLGIKANHELEMVTARKDGKPQWDQHWFSLTCGPRLLREGKIWLAPKLEGFSDPHVFDVGGRAAIGFNAQKDQLFLVTFLNIISLEKEAELMKAIGCYEAMNLDGGASKCVAYRGNILVNGGRPLTNVIVVYDSLNPAPQRIKDSWLRFQKGEKPAIP